PVIRIITPPAHSFKDSCGLLNASMLTGTFRKQPTKMLPRKPKRQKDQTAPLHLKPKAVAGRKKTTTTHSTMRQLAVGQQPNFRLASSLPSIELYPGRR